jgi:endoglucanase
MWTGTMLVGILASLIVASGTIASSEFGIDKNQIVGHAQSCELVPHPMQASACFRVLGGCGCTSATSYHGLIGEQFDARPIRPPAKTDIALDRKTALFRVADNTAIKRPDGVRLLSNVSGSILDQGQTVTNTLDVRNAVAGQKIRIQNSNHGASFFTTSFGNAVQTAAASIPGVTVSLVNAQQMEITLAGGSYTIPITQTVTLQSIPGNVDDAPWAGGTQLQTDWLLSSAQSNGAPVESAFAVVSKWITYTRQGLASDARWSLLRSVPDIGAGGSVTFEVGKTNHALASPTKLRIAVNGASTAGDRDFTEGLHAAINKALNADISYDGSSGTLTFGPNTVFPFTFTMTAGTVVGDKDYVLEISANEIGQIDVAQAGVRLGKLTLPSMTPLLGLNEASGEFGIGKYNTNYSYPGGDRLDWVAAQGFGIVRVPFAFQNIQAASSARVDDAALQRLDAVLSACAARHIVCLLDMHSFGNYYLDDSASGLGLPGSIDASNARLANLWAQIANRYKGNSYVWFDLMNEPNQQTALEWVKTDNAIAAAIRATGATNKIIFQGTAWQGAWTWVSSGNATQMLKAYDPGNNYAFEAHQYLDGNGSGTSPTCVAGSGATRLNPFTTWLQANGLQGIIGEAGWAANNDCANEAAALLAAWKAAPASTSTGGYIGFTYWAAGPWWADNYMYLAEPRPFPTGPEPAQLTTLKRYVLH